jgi:nucleoid-associated protein YejK
MLGGGTEREICVTRPTGLQAVRENERFTVTLIATAVQAVATLMRITGLSKTDVINRSVQVYGFLAEQMQDGKEVLLRDEQGNLERVHIV